MFCTVECTSWELFTAAMRRYMKAFESVEIAVVLDPDKR